MCFAPHEPRFWGALVNEDAVDVFQNSFASLLLENLASECRGSAALRCSISKIGSKVDVCKGLLHHTDPSLCHFKSFFFGGEWPPQQG